LFNLFFILFIFPNKYPIFLPKKHEKKYIFCNLIYHLLKYLFLIIGWTYSIVKQETPLGVGKRSLGCLQIHQHRGFQCERQKWGLGWGE
jgi:hypothetical protein